MSECVIRMEIPESCDVCPCLDDYDDYPRCRISGEQRGYNFPTREKRMPNCPIICQLPEGHGDLISRYAIAIACPGQIRMEDGEYWIRLSAVQESVNSTPTIVPAERRET